MAKELKAQRLRRQIDELNEELSKHQDKCKHPNAVGEYGANTGNYDPTADIYWIHISCPTCGKWWSVNDRDPNFREICRTTKTKVK